MRYLALAIMLAATVGPAVACESTPPNQSVDDVVFNHITAQTAAMDEKLQSLYDCKYVFAMVFESSDYESMRLISGKMPLTPTNDEGKPLTGMVLIGFVLNTDGVPSDPVVVQSESDELSKIALEHVLGIRFQPAKYKSRVVRSLGVQAYIFK